MTTKEKLPKRRWWNRFLPRFSLRTLLILVLLAASGLGLWWRWEPWEMVIILAGTKPNFEPQASFSPDGLRLLTVDSGRKGQLWDAQTGNRLFEVGEKCERARFTPDGRWIVCNPQDDRISVWNAGSGAKQAELEEGLSFDQVDCSPDGGRLLTKTAFRLGVATRGAAIWETDSGRLIGELAADEYVSKVAFSPDGKKALTVCNKSEGNTGNRTTVRIWNVSSGDELGVLREFQDDVHFASFLPDGKRLLTVCIFKVRIWEVASGKELDACNAAARWVVLSPCGKRLLAMESPTYGTVIMRLWDVESLTLVATLEQAGDHVMGSSAEAAFSSDGKLIIVDGQASIWSGEDGRILYTLSDPLNHPHAASFDPSNTRIASTGDDGTTRVWERRRPEWWWGVAWLPEFWLTVVFCIALVWSLWRDWKTLRGKPAEQAKTP